MCFNKSIFSSKTSLKEMVDEEEQAADGDEDDESETSNDENMFVIEVDKVFVKIQHVLFSFVGTSL